MPFKKTVRKRTKVRIAVIWQLRSRRECPYLGGSLVIAEREQQGRIRA